GSRLEHAAQPADSRVDDLRGTVGEVEADEILPRAVREKRRTWDEGDVLGKRLAEKLLAVYAAGKLRPDEQAALRARPASGRRKIRLQRLQHRVATGTVERAEPVQVGRVIEAREHPGNRVLHQRAGVQVDRLLGNDEGGDDPLGRNPPADAQPGADRFGEGAQVDDQALAIQRGNRRTGLAAIAQLAIWIILEDRHPVATGDRQELLAAGSGGGGALLGVGGGEDVGGGWGRSRCRPRAPRP